LPLALVSIPDASLILGDALRGIKNEKSSIPAIELLLAGVGTLALLGAVNLIAQIHAAGEDRPNLDSVIFHTSKYGRKITKVKTFYGLITRIRT
jgi:hypothetical protein